MKVENRHGDIIMFAETTQEGVYKLVCNSEMIRIGGGESDDLLDFIDPPGGPFISKGYVLPNGKVVNSISGGFGKILLNTNESNS